jgi:hypothetical protein
MAAAAQIMLFLELLKFSTFSIVKIIDVNEIEECFGMFSNILFFEF